MWQDRLHSWNIFFPSNFTRENKTYINLITVYLMQSSIPETILYLIQYTKPPYLCLSFVLEVAILLRSSLDNVYKFWSNLGRIGSFFLIYLIIFVYICSLILTSRRAMTLASRLNEVGVSLSLAHAGILSDIKLEGHLVTCGFSQGSLWHMHVSFHHKTGHRRIIEIVSSTASINN